MKLRNSIISAAVSMLPSSTPLDQLRDVQAKDRDGASFSDALVAADAFDPSLQQMAALGEKGEHLPELMRVAADVLEDGLRKRFQRLVDILVPALTITIGLVVGSLVMMTIGAVLSVNDTAVQ